jgi:hypothetical protein
VHCFTDLNQTERRLLRAASAGEVAVAAGAQWVSLIPENDTVGGPEWKPERDVRPDLLRWLCSRPRVQRLVDPRGIQLFAARISGPLNLSHVTVPFPVRLLQCFFVGDLMARDATFETLDLRGSILAGKLWATGVKIKHDLSLSSIQGPPRTEGEELPVEPSFRAEKGVYLGNAAIGGDMTLSGASLNGVEGVALHMDGASVDGTVFLGQNFTAKGAVRLVGANIGGDLNCSGGAFDNPGGDAFLADSICVKKSVFLREKFTAKGSASLIGANIEGNFDCSAGTFENPKGHALSAGHASVKGDVLLREKFSAKGTVWLIGANIDGDLDCSTGTFEKPGTDALTADGIAVKGNVFLATGFTAKGEVRFISSELGGDLICNGGAFEAPSGYGLLLQSAHIHRGVNLSGMTLDSRTGLSLLECSAARLVDDAAHWPRPGKLRLAGFKYGSIAATVMQAGKRLEWLRLQYPLAEDMQFSLQPYRHLAGILRAHGLDDDASKVLIAMEDDRSKYAGLSKWEKFLSCILQVTVGYGYRPFWAVRWLFLLWVLGWLAFASLYQSGRLVPAQKEAFAEFRSGHAPPPYYETFCAPIYSADVVLPLVNLGQRDAWRPLSPLEAGSGTPAQASGISSILCGGRLTSRLPWFITNAVGHIARPVHWFLILAGWFFATMFALGITGLVRRD